MPAAPPFVDQLSSYQRASLDLERDKLELERSKAKWNALSVGIPIVGALITFVAAVITLFWQARAQFRMKAAELVLASYSPWAAQSRARLLSQMFARWLPADFAESFQMELFPGTRLQEMRTELFRALRVSGAKEDEVIRHWLAVFPGERARFAEIFPDLVVPAAGRGSTESAASDVGTDAVEQAATAQVDTTVAVAPPKPERAD
ncbi:hypothetical protein ACQR1W_08570 [Bradyrhizobium sp. HKCCYLS1011]|uniref:hypothetical protein n=1 Tax=Bradyrhizobium sp. HKCCYLS1011 TaxID=3420733 RepID=UPI003EBB501F